MVPQFVLVVKRQILDAVNVRFLKMELLNVNKENPLLFLSDF